MDSKGSQCEEIISYLRTHKSISPLDAMQEIGCMRLAARIADLEKAGYLIKHQRASLINRKGQRVYFMTYSLEE